MPTPPRLKVCCIASIEEARLAIAAGAHALGLVARMPSGPGPIPDDAIRSIALATPPPIATFLLTSETEPAAVVDHVRRTAVNTVQLVDDAATDAVRAALRAELPAIRIVQVVHVTNSDSITLALRIAPQVDALLLDSGNPAAPIRELGGTGRIHDWSLSRAIVERSPVPVFLAGGLNASNITEAVRTVRPYGIDLCSALRTNGNLDPAKLTAFTTTLAAAIT